MPTTAPTSVGGQTPRNKKLVISIVVLSALVLALLAILLWCLTVYHRGDPATPATETPIAATGPCTEGTENTAPEGFVFYENAALGYRFAYPSTWGDVTVSTMPIAGESGDYVQGKFSAKGNVWFGGNAVDYIVRGRDGIPTDLPGYLEADGAFYTVELWQFSDGSSTQARDDLHKLHLPYEKKPGCNTDALMTHWEASEVSSVGPADIARFNLQPGNQYYGVNFVADKPDPATDAQFDSLISTFQRIP